MTSLKTKVIAIDGPAASGKTSVGKIIAEKLKFNFLDTGIMYRAITYAALNSSVDFNQKMTVSEFLDNVDLQIIFHNFTDLKITLNNIDISKSLHSLEIDQNVSYYSSFKEIRNFLVQQQRQIANRDNIVMVGRDIGSVVAPDSIKIFLTASVSERAKRRHKELIDSGVSAELDEIESELERRDELDSQRKESPLVIPGDATIVVSDGMILEGVVSFILNNILARKL
ncbi:MAG: (d)CMP kinase [SAR202 cluster bacterium]|mgnify:CR=1 FL=1|nr:cytidylate kinase [Chloroflexota bacterium]MQG50981.1 (d)CMP kinase [SAR202 cluster bacterium]|tara:strand:- start:220 stop:900 length:681 start_codon:yes stop_codon:yes gene_type:complete